MRTILTYLAELILVLFGHSRQSPAQDAAAQIDRRDRLRRRIRDTWKTRVIWPPLVLLIGGCLSSSPQVRTVYVPDGTPVRLRETVRNAKVWVLDAGGEPVAGVMDLPEGWYALPDEE